MIQNIGLALVVAGGALTGFRMAWTVRYELQVMEQLSGHLQSIRGHLSYDKTPLPSLFRQCANGSNGAMADFWNNIAVPLETGAMVSVYEGVVYALAQCPKWLFSTTSENILKAVGRGLGNFQLENQLGTLELGLSRLEKTMERYRREQSGRVKSYCALGICGGLAVAILLA